MSLALLGAVVRAFTQYNNLSTYLRECFKCLNNIKKEKPLCFIRCDVAHVIKLVTTWTPLRMVDVRVKEFIIRSIAQFLLSDNFDDLKNLLKHFFWLIQGKTDGRNNDGNDTMLKKDANFYKNGKLLRSLKN